MNLAELAEMPAVVNDDWRDHLPVRHLSPSSMNLFVSCPESFRSKYILSKKEKWFGDRFMGAADHETVAEALRLRMAGDTVLEPQVKQIYRDAWTRLLEGMEADGDTVDWRGVDSAEMYARGLQMALAYCTTVVPTLTPIAVEERLEITFDGLTVIGYADLIEVDKVRERKTSAQKTKKPKSRWRFQGRIYQMMVGLPVQWDVVTRQVTTQIVTADEEPGLRMELVDMEVTKQMVVNIAKGMSNMMSTIGPDNQWPLDGYFSDWGCDYCGLGPRYSNTCPAWK